MKKKLSDNRYLHSKIVRYSVILLFVFFACNNDLPKSFKVIKEDDINGVIISRNNKKLLIYGDPEGKNTDADKLLLTHCRRELLWISQPVIESEAETYIPEEEMDYFIKTDSFWNDLAHLRYHDYHNQTTRYPARPVKNGAYLALRGGDSLNWQGIAFRVFDTPGYARGAISYVAEVDKKTVAFTGDLIYGDGQLFDLYSLQDEIKGLTIRGYHGYAGRMADLIKSLEVIKDCKPDIIVPSRGPVIRDPGDAIDKLISRMQHLYGNYLSTSAFRWYTGIEKQVSLAERAKVNDSLISWMPLAETRDEDFPWLRHINNSVLIVSETGAAFLIDCGIRDTYEKLIEKKDGLRFKDIEGIFITHYHDDHTEFVPGLSVKFSCPVYIREQLEDILVHPDAYRMPCMIDNPVPDIQVVPEGHKMKWHEFTFTFYDFPGQTFYHDAMLVECKDDQVFFIGDSFSPSGLDDYCLQNRNLIQDGKGYLYCISLLRNMPPDIWLVNQHIHKLFRFSGRQLDFMEQKLRERESILSGLSPWMDINYFIDEQWARFYPYGTEAEQGQDVEVSLIIMNHQKKTCTYHIKPNAYSPGLSFFPPEKHITIPANTEGKAVFRLSASRHVKTGLHVITSDINYKGITLHEWSEGIINFIN